MFRLPSASDTTSNSVEDRLDGTVEGRLEGVVDGRVVGWAWSPRAPLERIWVSVFVDDESVGLVAADLERVDLLAAGLGDGAHGFSVELPARLRDSGSHALRVMAGRSNTQLPAASDFVADDDAAWCSSNGNSSAVRGRSSTAEATASPMQESIASSFPNARIDGHSPWRPLTASPLGALRVLCAHDTLRRYGPQTALAAGLVANLVLLLVLARHVSFFQDDYLFILQRRGWNAHTFLAAMNGHLSLMPVAIFKLLFLTVGISHIWPYRLVIVAIDSACVILLYLLIARRAGRAVALVPAGLLLILGSGTGSIDLLWITQIGFLLSLAAGAAALLCLSRGNRPAIGQRTDRAAAALLTVSLASSSPSLAMCAGALTYMLATRAPLRRYWVALGPLALYGFWYLGYGTQGLDISNITKVPDYVVQIASASFGALVGLSGQARTQGFGAALLMVGVVTFVSHTRQGRRLPPLAMAGIAGALTFWILAALTRAQTNNAASVRYLYPSAIFILIAFGGLLSWHKLTAGKVALIACVLLTVGLGNLKVLNATIRLRTKLDDQMNVVLGAADVIGPAGNAAFKPKPPYVPYLSLGSYLAAAHQLGTPALTPRQIEGQAPANRLLADQTIIAGEQIGLWYPPRLEGAVAPTVETSKNITISARPLKGASCLGTTPAAPGASIDVVVPPGRALYLSLTGKGTVTLYARRLAAAYPQQPLDILPSTDGPRGLGFPLDASRLPWHVRLLPTTVLVTCLGSADTQ